MFSGFFFQLLNHLEQCIALKRYETFEFIRCSFLTYETELVLFLAVEESSVLPMG